MKKTMLLEMKASSDRRPRRIPLPLMLFASVGTLMAMLGGGTYLLCAKMSAAKTVQLAKETEDLQRQRLVAVGKSGPTPLLYDSKPQPKMWEIFLDIVLHVEVPDQKSIVDSEICITEQELIEKYDRIKEEGLDRKQALTHLFNSHYQQEEEAAEIPEEEYVRPVLHDLPRKYAKMVEGTAILWNKLYRKGKEQQNQEQENQGLHKTSSLIPYNHAYFVPGGRFKEAYYWDTYWIAKGLHVCGRGSDVRTMLRNFADMLEKHGCIFNGNRYYYMNRSQPPFFTQMLADTQEAISGIRDSVRHQLSPKVSPNSTAQAEEGSRSGKGKGKVYEMDSGVRERIERLKEQKKKKQAQTPENIPRKVPAQPLLAESPTKVYDSEQAQMHHVPSTADLEIAEKEVNYWINNRVVYAQSAEKKEEFYMLFRYGLQKNAPRPEMLLCDLTDELEYKRMFGSASSICPHIVAATESGWDFSKRWRTYYPHMGIYGFLHTNNILPVDLNCIILRNFKILAEAYGHHGNAQKQQHYEALARNQAKSIDRILWDGELGRWRDVVVGEMDTTRISEEAGIPNPYSVYPVSRKEDSAFYFSDLFPLYMDLVDREKGAAIFEHNEHLVWTASAFLPVTSGHIAAPDRTIEEVRERLQGSEMLQPPTDVEIILLLEQHNKRDQWDGDSVWPNLAHLLIEYLVKSRQIEKACLAAQSYMDHMNEAYSRHKSLPEKILLSKQETGEYKNQLGFGWSNGVAQWISFVFGPYLDLL